MTTEFSSAEKIILRNQRWIMLALANISANQGGMCSGMYQEKLTQRVKEMERAFEWIATPGERIA